MIPPSMAVGCASCRMRLRQSSITRPVCHHSSSDAYKDFLSSASPLYQYDYYNNYNIRSFKMSPLVIQSSTQLQLPSLDQNRSPEESKQEKQPRVADERTQPWKAAMVSPQENTKDQLKEDELFPCKLGMYDHGHT